MNKYAVGKNIKLYCRMQNMTLDQLAEALAERGVRFRYSASAAAYIGENSYSSRFGARNMRRFIQVNVEDPLANRIIAARDRKITDAYLDTANGSLAVTCSES